MFCEHALASPFEPSRKLVRTDPDPACRRQPFLAYVTSGIWSPAHAQWVCSHDRASCARRKRSKTNTGTKPGHRTISTSPPPNALSLLSLGDEQFAQLAQPQDGAGNRDAHEPVSEIQTHGTERGLQERCVDDQDLQRNRQHERAPQPRVTEQPVERAALVRTGVGALKSWKRTSVVKAIVRA